MDFAEYEDNGRNAYVALAEVVASILTELIRADGRYRLQQIMCRAKSPESLLKKLRDRSLESSTAIGDEIKDLAGHIASARSLTPSARATLSTVPKLGLPFSLSAR